jgi:hypothetical protein
MKNSARLYSLTDAIDLNCCWVYVIPATTGAVSIQPKIPPNKLKTQVNKNNPTLSAPESTANVVPPATVAALATDPCRHC